MAGNGAGDNRGSRAKRCRLADAERGTAVWKHFTKQAAVPVQAFCGQSGQGLAGLWQGMLSAPAAASIGAPADEAWAEFIGPTTETPSNARMLSDQIQRLIR